MEHETLDVSGLRATVLLNPRAGTLARMEGDPAERVRAAFEYLRDLGDDLSSVQLVIAGETVILVRQDELIDVVNKHRGQGVLNFLALEGVVEQVDAAILELRPLDAALAASTDPVIAAR